MSRLFPSFGDVSFLVVEYHRYVYLNLVLQKKLISDKFIQIYITFIEVMSKVAFLM